MSNVFQIGGKVSGASFIGRKDIVKELRKAYVESDYRTCKAIIGLTRSGKSSIALNVFNDLPDNICYIYEDLREWDDYHVLWQDICLQIKKYIRKKGIDEKYLLELLDEMNEDNLPWIKLNNTVKDILEELSDIGVKTIMVLDEFDNAMSLFEQKTTYFELFRTIFSDGKYNVSAMTISRRNLHTIEGTTYQSSTFHGVLDTKPLRGFDDNDVEEYYQVFKDNGIELDEKMKKEIEYYAGRAPFLLSILGHYIIEAHEEGNEIDITTIFNDKCKSINDYYRDCIEHLKRDDDLKRIIPFVIGPNIGVTKADKNELINLGYLRETDDKLVAISEYFMTFLSNSTMNISIWDNIINLEKKLKLLVEKEFVAIIDHYQVGGETIKDLQRNILSQVDDISPGDIGRYDNFISSSERFFNVEADYLSVMSLTDTIKIIKECWEDVFSQYFDNTLYSEWETKLNKCSNARNPVAHGHEEYLSNMDKDEIDIYCKQIFEILSKTQVSKNFASAELILETAAKYPIPVVYDNIVWEDPDSSLVGKTVDIKILKKGGAKRNNLSGIIDNKYKGTIPASFLSGVDLDAAIETVIQVKIDRIDGDHYLLSL